MKISIYTYNRFPLLNIDNIGVSDSPEITKFGPGIRREHVIIYILNGEGYFNNNKLKKGQGFIALSKTLNEFYSSPSNPWTILWITSCDNEIEHLIKYYKFDRNTCTFNYDFVDELIDISHDLRNMDSLYVKRAEMLEIYMKIFKHHSTEPINVAFSSEKQYIDYATHFISTNYQKPISVKDLTKILGVSQPYLFKIFKKNFNSSPKDYITEYKINIAKQLLVETDYTINLIAKSVGYNDTNNFSKIFTKKKGISPSKYRENERKNLTTALKNEL